jgi:hypothetical protein
MKRFMLAAVAGAILMSGCAADATQGQGQGGSTLNRDDPPLGSLIKRKPGSPGAQTATQADIQALENARTMGMGNTSGR